jgi:hypothetical protein
MDYWLDRFADTLEWLILYIGNTTKRMKDDLSDFMYQALGIIIATAILVLLAIWIRKN